MKKINIAIDGPGGAGKSTAAKALAAKMGILYIDTGAMYRAVAVRALDLGIDIADISAVEKMLDSFDLRLTVQDGKLSVFVNGEDCTRRIREHHVSDAASAISALKSVRLKMVELQRQMAKENDCVLDGRDIGTFVLPAAPYKFFLTADIDERAKRRYLELKSRGQIVSLEQVKEDMRLRDERDSSRDLAPLKQAEDAILIDSTKLSIQETVELMYNYINSGERKLQ